MQESFISVFSLIWALSVLFFCLGVFAVLPILTKLNDWLDRLFAGELK